MMKILGLSDGFYRPFFVCEDCKTEYSDDSELIAFLAKPHDFEVEVKMFYLNNCPIGRLEKYTDGQIKEMFDFLEGYGHPPCGLTDQEVFEMFWASADENW